MLKERLKPIYLLFLTIPLVYFLLWTLKTEVPPADTKLDDYFFFSVKTSSPSTLSLIANEDTLATWDVNTAGYKNLQYVGQLNDSTGLKIAVNNLGINDTISFSEFNLYRNNQLFSIYEYTVENASLIEKNGILNTEVQLCGKPIIINLKPSSEWESIDKNNHFYLYIFLIFIIVFLLLLVFLPPVRYFIFSMFFSILVMILCFFTDTNNIGRVIISSSSQIKFAEVFYNQNPFFTSLKKHSSEGTTNAYSIPLNFETERFLRCDVGDTIAELKDFQIKFELGIFHKIINLASVPQDKLVLNDLVLRGNTYYITGNDPYIMLTSNFFTGNIKWLLLLEGNIFLFIALFVFLFLVSIHRFTGRINKTLNKIKFKTAYLTFLLIPLTYFLIIQLDRKETASKSPDQIYFSARTSNPATFSLFNGNDSVTSWTMNSSAFKYLEYACKINYDANLYLKVENLSENDTLSLLSINFFQNDQVYCLFDKNEPVCTIKNARLIDKSGEVSAIVLRTNEAVIVNLLPFNVLSKNQPKHGLNNIIILLFFIIFIIVLIIAPRPGYFIASCIIISLLMFIYFWISNDWQAQVVLKTSSPLKSAQFFYNDNPNFLATQKNDVNSNTHIFKTEVDIVADNYLRCDIADTLKELNNLCIYMKTGILKNNLDYSTILSENIMMNDIIKRGETYYIHGDDPYFILTSANQIQSIRWMILIRQNIFFLLTIILFLILIFLNKLAKKHNPSAFFLVVVFFVSISFALTLRLFNSDSIILQAEMRYANKYPNLQLDSAGVFIKETDNYIKDQIPGRNNIIRINNLVEYSIFGQLVDNPKIHFGKDGWLFYIGEKCRENYENRHPLSTVELKKMKDVLVARRDWLKERGMKFYLIFPPMAYFVYEDKVGPRLWRYNKQSKIDQLLEYLKLHTDLDVVDIFKPLVEAKKKSPFDLYYKTNSHWNHFGGYVAYNAMIKYIKKDFPDLRPSLPLKDITWVDFDTYNPDLLLHVALDKFFTCHEYKPSNKKMEKDIESSFPVYQDYSSPMPPFCFYNKSVERPSMLLYGDSYSGFLLFYLSYNFSRSVFLFTPLFYPSIIEQEKPDIVIQEMNDYSISNILYQNPPLPAMKDTIQIKSD